MVPTGNQPWQAQRVVSLALRRRHDHLSAGSGICPVVDARPVTDGVRVDLLVPVDVEPLGAETEGESERSTNRQFGIDEVQRLLTPIVESLCLLHDAGSAHGGIGMTAIRRRPDGRGVLVGFDPDASTEQDVAQFAGIILDLVPSGSIDGQDAALLTRAIDHDPHRPPAMVDLAMVVARLSATTRPGSGRQSWVPENGPTMALVSSPPARRRRVDLPGQDCPELARSDAAASSAVDPIAHLRRTSSSGAAASSGTVTGQQRQGDHPARTRVRRAGSRRARSRHAGRSVPWPIITAMAGSSAVTWIVASMLR